MLGNGQGRQKFTKVEARVADRANRGKGKTKMNKLGMITMRWMFLPCLFTAAILATKFPAFSQPLVGDAASGREIATTQCSSCHRVLPMTLADKADPPSFQSLADLPSTTGISLNAFLHSDHKNMPNFIISSADSNDLIAYILSLKKN
jgi:mono/diheme cytochrome c family protein